METLPSISHLRSLEDNMEPEDMKSRRLAALKEFGLRNPKYQKLIRVQLLLERRGGTHCSVASHRKRSCEGKIQRTYQKAAEKRITKKRWWTTESSLELVEAVTKFQKSGSQAMGDQKWKIIAADLMQQPNGPAAMSLTESAKCCRIRYSNMLARRHAAGSSFSFTAELKEKLEKTKFLDSSFRRPLTSPHRTAPGTSSLTTDCTPKERSSGRSSHHI